MICIGALTWLQGIESLMKSVICTQNMIPRVQVSQVVIWCGRKVPIRTLVDRKKTPEKVDYKKYRYTED